MRHKDQKITITIGEPEVIFETTPDPEDGHVHDIPIWALDDEMTGSTAPAKMRDEDEPHVHAIVNGKIRPFVRDGMKSTHDSILDEDGEEVTPSRERPPQRSSPRRGGPERENEEAEE